MWEQKAETSAEKTVWRSHMCTHSVPTGTKCGNKQLAATPEELEVIHKAKKTFNGTIIGKTENTDHKN